MKKSFPTSLPLVKIARLFSSQRAEQKQRHKTPDGRRSLNMAKIAMIGAGSVVFCRTLVNDILTVPELRDCTIHLMDIDPERLTLIEKLIRKIVKEEGLPTEVAATTDRREALQDARYVVVMIQVGGVEAYRLDHEIPLKYGVDQCIGDTLGPGGVFRGLRSFPVLIALAKEMEEVCPPDALLMNYSNPMAMNTWAIFENSPVHVVGLCHGVQGTAEWMARMIGAPVEKIDYWCAGINHMAWFLQFRRDGKDAYPDLKRVLSNSETVAAENERVRCQMMENFGYFMTETSGHLSEYVPWYRKRQDLMERFMGSRFGGETGFYLRLCEESLEKYLHDINQQIAGEKPARLTARSTEYCSYILEACETGRPFRFNGNVRNTGLITNLSQGCCVEVPCFADRLGIHPVHVGDLPPQCAALCRSNVTVQELAVKGGTSGERNLVFQAVLHDPLTAAVCGIDEVREMVDELFAAQARWLPQFAKEIS
jgi:alpha-galactosidase